VGRHNRWTILAHPSREVGWPEVRLGGSGLREDPWAPPFRGGWVGLLDYELGAGFEPAAGAHPARTGCMRWLQCEDALIYDRRRRRWWAVGNPPALDPRPALGEFKVGPVRTTMSGEEYQKKVARIIEYIRAGDVYQVNLAHHLESEFSGSSRSFFLELAASAEPWYGAYVETGDGAVCSASPELLLSLDPGTRRLTTRPMKGTRRAAAPRHELEFSAKDAAELNMITDLMRNDLGRVCELGSVRVDRPRDLERHGTREAALFQTTATVSGVLRRATAPKELFAATFPGGSVTGAPKIRAMQIIAELEPRPRGHYCGAIGFVSRSGHAAFNIAIRTATISAGVVSYGVGAGIVADSDPSAEWRETLDKAGVFLRAAGGQGIADVSTGEHGRVRQAAAHSLNAGAST
jgi:para-aminobenzoate synthetase component 1